MRRVQRTAKRALVVLAPIAVAVACSPFSSTSAKEQPSPDGGGALGTISDASEAAVAATATLTDDFERATSLLGPWTHTAPEGEIVPIDTTDPHSGKRSLHIPIPAATTDGNGFTLERQFERGDRTHVTLDLWFDIHGPVQRGTNGSVLRFDGQYDDGGAFEQLLYFVLTPTSFAVALQTGGKSDYQQIGAIDFASNGWNHYTVTVDLSTWVPHVVATLNDNPIKLDNGGAMRSIRAVENISLGLGLSFVKAGGEAFDLWYDDVSLTIE